jgi:hypothetical protein
MHTGSSFAVDNLPTRPHPGKSGLRLLSPLLFLALLCLVQPASSKESSKVQPREQLSVGYSLLYQEADGIPKLKWILLPKEKTGEMGAVTRELIGYYQQLAERMEKLSKEISAMRINAEPLPEIVAAARKSIGEDLARDIAPLVGRKGADFERETLLMFLNALDEQRHLVRVMRERETEPALRKFLQTTQAQLDEHYRKVGSLLDKHYFKH